MTDDERDVVDRYAWRPGDTLGDWAKRVNATPAECLQLMFGGGPLMERIALETAEPKGEA